MKVSELIAHLQTFPQDLEVGYKIHSEQELMTEDQVGIFIGCKPRADGWIQNKRPDMETQQYVMFPGN